jgi:hypothetical protein
MANPRHVSVENGFPVRIVGRGDRFADLPARAAKEGWCGPPASPTERVKPIRHCQHRQLIIRIPGDRKTQK